MHLGPISKCATCMIPFSFPVMIPAILLTWCIFASCIHVLISFYKETILFTTKCKVWKHKMGSEGKENQETIHLFSWTEESANSKTPRQNKAARKQSATRHTGRTPRLSRANIGKQPGFPVRSRIHTSKHGVRSWKSFETYSLWIQKGTGNLSGLRQKVLWTLLHVNLK